MPNRSALARIFSPEADMTTGAELLAANIARLRLARGLSQADLARRLGISPAAVAALEARASSELTLDEIDTFAKALEVAPLDLFQPVQ